MVDGLRTSPPAPVSSIDLASPAIADDPLPHYEALRRGGPVHFLSHHDAWIVLGFDEVRAAFGRPDQFSTRPHERIDMVLLGAEREDHAPIHRIVSSHFSAEVLQALSALAEERAASLLAPEMDIVEGLAQPLSDAVAARLLGFEDDAAAAIRRARHATPQLAPFTRVLAAMAPRAVMYRRLMEAGISAGDAASLVRLLWLAGTIATARTISSAVLRLLRDPHLRLAIAQDHSKIPAFVEEVLRLDSPEHFFPRVTTERVELGGVEIPARATVFLCLAAANRDPGQYDAPGDLRLDRPQTRHLTFGYGLHHCIGAALARREVAIAIRTLLARAPRFAAAEPLASLEFHSTMSTRVLKRLLVRTGIDRASGRVARTTR